MFGPSDQAGWLAAATAALMSVPTVLVSACVVVVALLSLTARSTRTRQHCLAVLAHLTRYVRVLRGKP